MEVRTAESDESSGDESIMLQRKWEIKHSHQLDRTSPTHKVPFSVSNDLHCVLCTIDPPLQVEWPLITILESPPIPFLVLVQLFFISLICFLLSLPCIYFSGPPLICVLCGIDVKLCKTVVDMPWNVE